MNAADRKLIREFLTVLAEFGHAPDAKIDHDARNRVESQRLLTIADHAEWVTSDDDGMPRRMATMTRMLRDAMAKPLPYEVVPPEYADLCVCGAPRSSHIGLTGKYILAESYPDKYSCPGFTLATTTEGRKQT